MKDRAVFIFIIWISLSLALVLTGCAGHKKPDSEAIRVPQPASSSVAEKAEAAQRVHQEQTGSLYSRGQGSLFTANKAGRVGDILTVAIYEQASAEKEAETDAERSSSVGLGIPKLFGYEAALADKNPNLDPSQVVSASTQNDFEGSGTTSREEQLTATLTTQVVERMGNGNLRIAGSKTVRVNNEDQIIRLSGIVRPADITADNVINSKHILDARIEYSGDGVISEKQRPGWLARLFDIAWPF
ncbi:MAG: flagellar basal body L-ring protein FlgH [Thermodesulfobacteriota bacterium]